MPKRKVPPGPPAFFDEEAVSEFLRERGYDGTAVQRCYAIVCRAIRDLPLRDCDDAAAGIWETATDLAFNGAAGFPPAALAALRSHFVLFTTSVVATHESGDGCTTKSVVELRDSHHVEAVAMRHAKRSTVCVSSQVGCQMGCQFCATGTMGIIGDLTAAEIVEQFAYATLTERLAGRPAPKNVVFMGMGEPLQNYDAVRSAVEAFTKHFVLRKKAITVSTVGVVPNMRRLARDLPDVRLALSLHAPTQALREIIVPAARAWPLNDLMAALDDHLIVTKRIHDRTEAGLMIEYVLLGGVNDSDECADELADLLRGKNVMLNLIPYNPNVTAEMYGFVPPTEDRALAFGKRVVEKGAPQRAPRPPVPLSAERPPRGPRGA